MSKIIENLKLRAKKNKKTIVLPETMDKRVIEAASIILKEEIADIILVGKEEDINSIGQEFDLSKAKIIDPFTSELTMELQEKLYQLRKEKGMTEEDAYRLLTTDYMYYACMLVKMGYADGAVSGACHSTSNTLRPALQILKTKPGVKLVSAFFLMLFQIVSMEIMVRFYLLILGLNKILIQINFLILQHLVLNHLNY